MTIHTTSVRHLEPGTLALKHISDGHYYGVVASVERQTCRQYDWQDDYLITFEDGDTMTRQGMEPIYYKA